jgi:inorganic pyrophosphatase
MHAKPIGFMRMIDQGKQDDKVIAVHADDPEYFHYNDISELAPHISREIKNFFEIYKSLEGKKVDVQNFYDKSETIKLIHEALELYKTTPGLRS